jgi:predicted amidohydrolase YtcJ
MRDPMSSTLLRGGRTLVDGSIVPVDLVVDSGLIAYVGAPDTAARTDAVVELDGAVVLPAFVDGHVHATDTGLVLAGLDLSTVRSKTALLEAVARRTRELRGRAVLGHGWDETTWPIRELPTAAELDRASYGSVVYLSRVDVHSALASSALMASTPRLDQVDGFHADGWLRRDAHHLVRAAALGSLTGGQRQDAQLRMLQHAASLGIAAVHEMNGPGIGGADDVRLLQDLTRQHAVPEVIVYWGQTAADGGIDAVRDLGAHGAGGDLFVDGAVGSRTACLRAPYSDAYDTSGALYLDEHAIADHLVSCSRAGVQAGFHVIGDAAMDAVVHGLLAAAEALGRDGVRALRHRLEHAEMLDATQIAVLADLGVVASVQPAFDAAWGGLVAMYADRLGPERGTGLNPFSRMASAGIPLVLGSDAPVTPLDPWGGVLAAVRHRTAAHRIDPRTAFDAHTRTAHVAVGDGESGRLVAGAPATYAVWAADFDSSGWTELLQRVPTGRPQDQPDGTTLDAPHPGVVSPTCLRTVVRGTTVHDSGALEEVAA